MTNTNECVPNEYDLHDADGRFVRKERIETPDYEIVKLYRDGDKYYMATGGWRLKEVTCFHKEGT